MALIKMDVPVEEKDVRGINEGQCSEAAQKMELIKAFSKPFLQMSSQIPRNNLSGSLSLESQV